jgi:hypothetical protein
MENKPYPALLGGSYLFNEIKKRTPKSRETIPLTFRYAMAWEIQEVLRIPPLLKMKSGCNLTVVTD